MLYDCAIIGGGPAGLNAALVLGRARRSVALIDNNRPRNAVTHASHGFITRDGVTPSEFRRVAYEEVLRYPSVHHLQTEVVSIMKNVSGFEGFDSSGLRVQARKLILATGVKEIFPRSKVFIRYTGKVCLIALIATVGSCGINRLSLSLNRRLYFIQPNYSLIGARI